MYKISEYIVGCLFDFMMLLYTVTAGVIVYTIGFFRMVSDWIDNYNDRMIDRFDK